MESTQQFVVINKPLKLDVEHYGHWKVNMQQVIQGIDLESWIAVEEGWNHPTITDADGKKTLKPKKSWSAEEKREAKFNAKALSAILPLCLGINSPGCKDVHRQRKLGIFCKFHSRVPAM
ncbi:hypothetical protein V5N11_020008 [Cardamine amara subsp. amara]|uniref:Retrotransposon Copia-like N-terminal domain-containing protein n=1 Tax=Cardamine amara subsp. amara TaxID=228776 RepID=A0ABD0ZJP6_CARAN